MITLVNDQYQVDVLASKDLKWCRVTERVRLRRIAGTDDAVLEQLWASCKQGIPDQWVTVPVEE